MKPQRASYIMVGGFLGAGKTTAILKLADYYRQQGRKVGLITNDQATNLVDTQMAQASGFAVEEIAGGCFCCRFDSLVNAAQRLARVERPEVFIAEPVGSCTDLMATVSVPMQHLYGNEFAVAPLSVLVDPVRALRVLGLGDGRQFAPKVTYTYLKQLEEANLIVINKADLLDTAQRDRLQGALRDRFPQAEQFVVSAREGTGLTAWFERIAAGELKPRGLMDMDYITYGVGEAMMGWLNATVRVSEATPTDGNALLQQTAGKLRSRLDAAGIEVAHLKMILAAGGEIAVVNLVRTDAVPELSFRLSAPVRAGELTLNLRAQAEPAALEMIVREVLAGRTIGSLQCFKPGQPNPTHRMDQVGGEHRPVLPAGVA